MNGGKKNDHNGKGRAKRSESTPYSAHDLDVQDENTLVFRLDIVQIEGAATLGDVRVR